MSDPSSPPSVAATRPQRPPPAAPGPRASTNWPWKSRCVASASQFRDVSPQASRTSSVHPGGKGGNVPVCDDTVKRALNVPLRTAPVFRVLGQRKSPPFAATPATAVLLLSPRIQVKALPQQVSKYKVNIGNQSPGIEISCSESAKKKKKFEQQSSNLPPPPPRTPQGGSARSACSCQQRADLADHDACHHATGLHHLRPPLFPGGKF